jgi:hypothetical protein
LRQNLLKPPNAMKNGVIIAGVGVKNGVTLEPAVLCVSDLVPTFIDLAGATHPSATDPKLAPPRGKSLTPLLSGETDALNLCRSRIVTPTLHPPREALALAPSVSLFRCHPAPAAKAEDDRMPSGDSPEVRD